MKEEIIVRHSGKNVTINHTIFNKVQIGEAFFDTDENQWVKTNAAEGHVVGERTLVAIFSASEPAIRLTTTDLAC